MPYLSTALSIECVQLKGRDLTGMQRDGSASEARGRGGDDNIPRSPGVRANDSKSQTTECLAARRGENGEVGRVAVVC